MGDLLKQGAEFLHAQRSAHMASDVVFVRGAESVVLSATIGHTDFEEADTDGFIQRVQTRDYLVLAADLVLGGQPSTPVRGDIIRETIGEKVFVYEVMSPGNEPLWRWSDPHRNTIRIHTKHTDTEDA